MEIALSKTVVQKRKSESDVIREFNGIWKSDFCSHKVSHQNLCAWSVLPQLQCKRNKTEKTLQTHEDFSSKYASWSAQRTDYVCQKKVGFYSFKTFL